MRRQHKQTWAIEQRRTGNGKKSGDEPLHRPRRLDPWPWRQTTRLSSCSRSRGRELESGPIARENGDSDESRTLVDDGGWCRCSQSESLSARNEGAARRAGGREGKKLDGLSCHRWLPPGLKLTHGTWPLYEPAPGTTLQLVYTIHNTQSRQPGYIAVLEPYCGRAGATNVTRKEVAQETRKARPRADGVIY